MIAYNNSGVYTKAFIINPTGLVGINETTPSAQLQVKSGATNRVPLIVDTLASQTANLQEWKLNGTNKAIIDIFGSILTGAISNLANSNNALIQVLNEGTNISRNIADTNPALIVNLANASATGNIQVWQKAGVAQLAIGNNGAIANPTANNAKVTLSNDGTIIERNVADANPALVVDVGSSATGFIQRWSQNGSTKASINIDGVGAFNRGIQIVSDALNETIYVYDGTFDYLIVEADGDVYNKNGTYGTISDLRLKENITPARSYTEDLMKLNVVKYSFKADKSDKPTHLGFIAQEVEEVFPSMVETKKTKDLADQKAIKMSVLIPMLVKTIQELNKRIEELEKK
jgi:hypothetical protein